MSCNFESEVFKKIGEVVKGDDRFTQRTLDDEKYNTFIEQYPRDKISQLTLDDYCLGLDSKDNNFSWWLERGLRYLGSE